MQHDSTCINFCQIVIVEPPRPPRRFNRALSLGLDGLQNAIEQAGDDDELRELLTSICEDLSLYVPPTTAKGVSHGA